MLKKLFDLDNEKNLILENRVENVIYKNNNCKLLNGKIIQYDSKCIYCKSELLSKNGTYTSYVLLNKINNKKIILKVKKQRYFCRKCNKNFVPKVSFLESKKRISNQVLRQISTDLIATVSGKQIARQNQVSANTVERTVKKFKEYIKINKNHLPKILCVDEFRCIKNYNTKMNFLIVDGEKRKVKDILISRHKNSLIDYFSSYTESARKNVKFFVSDFYSTYINVSEKLFPEAKIIIDRFHVVRLINNVLKNKRVVVSKKFKKHHYPYKVLKKFKYILFKNFRDISIEYKHYKYYTKFQCEYDILNYILSIDKELEEIYWIYQDFIEAFNNKNENELREIINRDYSYTPKEIETTFNTYKQYEEYVVNSIKYPYSNGITEGINTKLKLLNRTGYGYRNFENFRIRALLIFNLVEFYEDIKRKRDRLK